MAADLFSPFIGMTLQATGNNNNDWGTILNGSLTTIERGLAGNISHAVNHNFSVTTGTESASHTHTYSFTTSTGSADGTEARPEALAVVVSIRY
jgi:hypothetical protein